MSLSEGQVQSITLPRGTDDRYRIVGAIGSGGMGTVYRADDTLLDRPVAIKVLSASSDPGSARQQLLVEARAASALNHPNICTIFEIGEEKSLPFIVMEYVEGERLSTLITPEAGLPIETVISYGAQIADALAHAHERGIVHRDLKSGNIIITSQQRAKVLDFGLAIRIAPGAADTDTSTLDDADSDSERGTPGTLLYMAPELLRGATADARTDIWALGVVLYEMAAGERPFSGQTPYELSAAILTEPIRLLPLKVPEGLRAVIARCLSKDPAARYRSTGEVRAALEALQKDERLGRVRPDWLRRTVVLVGMIALLVAILVTALAMRRLLQPTSPETALKLIVIPRVPDGTPFSIEAMTKSAAEMIAQDIARVDLPGLHVMTFDTALQYTRASDDLLELVHHETDATFVAMIRATQQGDSLVVGAELDDARDRRLMWGNSFPKTVHTDIFAVKDEIAANVADKISQQLTHRSLTEAQRQLLSRHTTRSEEAWQLYSEGRTYWYTPTSTADTYLKSLELYRQALQKDPNYALAYIGIADTHMSMAWEGWIPPKGGRHQSQEAFDKAMKIDSSLGERHYTKAGLLFWNGDWAAAEQEYIAGIREVPTSASNVRFYANGLALQGRFDDAIALIKNALESDPKGLGTNMGLGTTYYWAHRLDDAISQLKFACTLDSTAAAPHEALADIYETKGLTEGAIRERQEALRLVGDKDGAENLGNDFVHLGYQAATRSIYKRQLNDVLAQRVTGTYVSPVNFALLYIRLGKTDQAFEWLERAAEEEAAWLFYLKVDPAFDPIRNDPRFDNLVRRIRFLQRSALQRDNPTRSSLWLMTPSHLSGVSLVRSDPQFDRLVPQVGIPSN